ncbi:DUF647-domain-containing protein [Rhizoclosmatium globosum]|uniref:DUF647-domain-containing protein n=1 Tax=Rhizoclosmatium globosum TaxID=329046 RepID=A0A1Y2C265_9FUNG|nr:DUF647-domain-containing protein [Rhizoclosmatium globosum]|eukprot:ORY40405.1 DUF647-domain-containing protein [Rhizoclosmatium globosum]
MNNEPLRYTVTHPSTGTASNTRFLKDAFLPVGYPESVSPDYTTYQIFDSLQAFCSNITGNFKQAGVGDATASVTAATITWLLQDGTGMIGRILYAWRVSFFLDADCKQWRFYADILNDSASFIGVLTPMILPKAWFTFSACVASLLKALCGVTGGSTKAALSQHFAIRDNMADLHAKEGSQETVVGLVGMVLGSAIVHLVPDESAFATWSCFVTLHLVCNYCGISAVVMPSLNTQRGFLVIREYLESEDSAVMQPETVARMETIFWSQNYFNGSLWNKKQCNINAQIQMGVSLDRVIDAWSGGVNEEGSDLESIVDLFHTTSHHFLSLEQDRILVAIHRDATPVDVFLAYFHALILQKTLLDISHDNLKDAAGRRNIVKESVLEYRKRRYEFLAKLRSAGWEVEGVHQSRIYLHDAYRFHFE